MPQFSADMQNNFERLIYGNVISRKWVSQCVEDIETKFSAKEKSRYRMNAPGELKEIDILLIAYLTLYKLEEESRQFELVLSSHVKENNRFISLLRQYRAHVYMATGLDVLTVTFDNGDSEPAVEKNESWFEFSHKFAPVMLINRTTLKPLFFRAFDPISIKGFDQQISQIYDANNDVLFKSRKEAFLKLVHQFDPGNRTAAMSLLGFWGALFHAKILNYYIDEARSTTNKAQCGNLKGQEAVDHFNVVRPIFDQLHAKPPIYHFVYFLLLSSSLLPGSLDSENMRIFQKRIINLWDFAARLVTGLTELAQNIEQHSSERVGAITLRLYDQERFTDLVDIGQNEIANGLSALRSASVVFDINVIDLGRLGVVQTLAESVKKSAREERNEVLRNSFVADERRFENREIKLLQLLDRKTGIHLDHQAKRAVAHLGLQIFSSIVVENEGIISASTWGGNASRDSAIVSSQTLARDEFPFIRRGTNYNVLLPVAGNREYGTRLPGTFHSFTETTAGEIEQIETLFDVETVILNDRAAGGTFETKGVSKFLYLYQLQGMPLENRDDECAFWSQMQDACQSVFETDAFRALDFEQVPMTPSLFFRFMGRWELEYSGKPLIVFNIPNDLLFQLKKINEEFTRRLEVANLDPDRPVAYWNENTIQLVYSYIENDEQQRFHLVDALWGTTAKHFFAVNRLIRNINFNSISLEADAADFAQIKEYAPGITRSLRRFDLFYNGVSLLPFDLLLKVSEDETIFEQNARFLLMNELRPE